MNNKTDKVNRSKRPSSFQCVFCKHFIKENEGFMDKCHVAIKYRDESIRKIALLGHRCLWFELRDDIDNPKELLNDLFRK